MFFCCFLAFQNGLHWLAERVASDVNLAAMAAVVAASKPRSLQPRSLQATQPPAT
jgi:hypothetical protein